VEQPPVVVDGIEESIADQKARIAHQRQLQKTSNLPPQGSLSSSQSIRYEEDSAHYLDSQFDSGLNPIEIQAIV
jgi:hypothetical protein